ncbi:MAG: hypothetical protein GC204_03585 [Chloroflexi bacterium]|nr:hypothetical protein [Chloroflexota bacterium]
MISDDFRDHDDVGEAIREGRGLHQAREYRILFALDGLDFRKVGVPDPVPLGRQILIAGGLPASSNVSLAAILANGDFEDVRLDETFDLRGHGAERFVAFQTDRLFRLTLNAHEVQWGRPGITGTSLHKLAGAAQTDAVYLQIADGTSRLIEPDELVDLTKPGLEHFVTRPKPLITIIVNARPRHVAGPTVTFEQIVQLAFPGPHETNVVFSMTYRHATSLPHQGELGAGGIVKIKEGTAFNVTRTVQS